MKKRRYDFIIAYEHRNREIMSVCLQKKLLESKGYSVFLYFIEDRNVNRGKVSYFCDVLIMPYGYDDYRIFIATRTRIKFHKLVNLQWEQLFTKTEENDPNSYKTPKGLFKEYGVHIAWGEKNKQRLIEKAGISSDRIKICGHMAMDFLREPLCNMYSSRDSLLTQYNIDPTKKVRLYISSYKSAFSRGEVLENEIKRFGEWRRIQHEVLLNSFYETMRWYTNAMERFPDEIFIYRPHPGEKAKWSSEIIEMMQHITKKHSNFRIIESFSVQQWILAADWICIGGPSTSMVEAFFAGKDFCLLRPYELPEEIAMSVFDNAEYVKNEAEFILSLSRGNSNPIPSHNIFDYYDNHGKAYISVLNTLVKVKEDDSLRIPASKIKQAYKNSDAAFWKGHRAIWRNSFVQSMQYHIGRKFEFPRFCRKYYLGLVEEDNRAKKEIVNDEEINDIMDRLSRCLNEK